MTHQRKYRGDKHWRPEVNGLGWCDRCGKNKYGSRKDAKKAARQLSQTGLNAYQCGDFWHLGHLPTAVIGGHQNREEL